MIEYSKDIILNSNLSIRRNIKSYDFPTTMSLDESKAVIEIFRKIFEDKLVLLDEVDRSTIDRLKEEMVLSEDCEDKLLEIGLVFEGDTTIVINDRDHLSINISSFGTDIKSAFMRASEIEKVLDDHLDFAFSQEYGFLTSDARNTGFGLEIKLKMFLFALIDDAKTYYGFKQAMAYSGVYATSFDKKAQSNNGIYLLKNHGNYRQDIYSYLDKLEKDIMTLVNNERRFRRDYRVLNNIDDKKVKEDIDLILSNLKNGLIKSFDKMGRALYKLKEYRILGYDTSLSLEEIDYLIKNLSSSKYKDNFDPKREEFLREYMGG